MNIPRLYYECQILSSDGKGRYKIKFLENGFTPDVYIQAIQTSEGDGKEGEHGKYGEDDIVILSFLDYPQSQKPFIAGKFSGETQRYDATSQSTIMWKDHTLIFKDDSLEISHEDGTKITIEAGKIKLSKEGAFTKINYGNQDIIETLVTLIGNLGFPIVTTQILNLIENQKNLTNTITFE